MKKVVVHGTIIRIIAALPIATTIIRIGTTTITGFVLCVVSLALF